MNWEKTPHQKTPHRGRKTASYPVRSSRTVGEEKRRICTVLYCIVLYWVCLIRVARGRVARRARKRRKTSFKVSCLGRTFPLFVVQPYCECPRPVSGIEDNYDRNFRAHACVMKKKNEQKRCSESAEPPTLGGTRTSCLRVSHRKMLVGLIG